MTLERLSRPLAGEAAWLLRVLLALVLLLQPVLANQTLAADSGAAATQDCAAHAPDEASSATSDKEHDHQPHCCFNLCTPPLMPSMPRLVAPGADLILQAPEDPSQASLDFIYKPPRFL